jgi:hypothetical protein
MCLGEAGLAVSQALLELSQEAQLVMAKLFYRKPGPGSWHRRESLDDQPSEDESLMSG